MLTPNRPQKRLDYIAKQFGRTPRAVAYAMNAAAWLFDMEAQARYRRARERIFEADPGSEEFWGAYREAVTLFPAKGENDDIIVWFARELAKAEKAGDNAALESLADRLGRNAAAIALWREAERPDLMSMSVSDVEEALGEFDAARGARPPQGAVVLELDYGWTWQELEPSMLKCEGQHMKHCVGGFDYKRKVADGRSRILSLRDENGYPHVTVELDVEGQRILQVFGESDQKIGKDTDLGEKSMSLFEHLSQDGALGSVEQAEEVLEEGADEQFDFLTTLEYSDITYTDGGDLVLVEIPETKPILLLRERWDSLVENRTFPDTPQYIEDTVEYVLHFFALKEKHFHGANIKKLHIGLDLNKMDFAFMECHDFDLETDRSRALDFSNSRTTLLGLSGELIECSFAGNRAEGGLLKRLSMKRCHMTNAAWDLYFEIVDFIDCDFKGSRVSLEASLDRTPLAFDNCDMSDGVFTFTGNEGESPSITIQGCNLRGATFQDCDLSRAIFEGCDFDDDTQFVNCQAEDIGEEVPGWTVGPDGFMERI